MFYLLFFHEKLNIWLITYFVRLSSHDFFFSSLPFCIWYIFAYTLKQVRYLWMLSSLLTTKSSTILLTLSVSSSMICYISLNIIIIERIYCLQFQTLNRLHSTLNLFSSSFKGLLVFIPKFHMIIVPMCTLMKSI